MIDIELEWGWTKRGDVDYSYLDKMFFFSHWSEDRNRITIAIDECTLTFYGEPNDLKKMLGQFASCVLGALREVE